jgi:hypothetical protein
MENMAFSQAEKNADKLRRNISETARITRFTGSSFPSSGLKTAICRKTLSSA